MVPSDKSSARVNTRVLRYANCVKGRNNSCFRAIIKFRSTSRSDVTYPENDSNSMLDVGVALPERATSI